jgi:hypothetical protein
VTRKNRKVRRLRELYPQVRIKVLYQRDYLSLLAKYGLEPPSQMPAPSGSGGDGPAARARAAGRPRVVPDPPQPPPPLPADPELVRLAEVSLPAEVARAGRRPAAKRAG